MAILLVTTSTSSYGAEFRRVLTKSSWFQDEVGGRSHQELYAFAYTLEYLLHAQEVATQLSIDLAQSGKSEEMVEHRVSEIGGALSEVVIDAYNRSLPLLRLHPDKVVTQELIRHAIRYSGGVNEGWEAIIENLCVINGNWTIELLKELPVKDHEDLRCAIIDPNGRDESGLDETVLSLIAKAEQSEQASAGQASPKPADKPPVKNQPSTPTPKVVPR